MEKRYYKIIILLLLAVIVGLLFLRIDTDLPTDTLKSDDNAVEWNGKQDISHKQQEGGIAIPGFDVLVLNANSLEQKVNLYNPEINDCLFLMTLYIEKNEYWKSGYISPGDGYYDILLTEKLAAGNYNGALKIQCFKSDSTELNSAIINFDVEVD